MDNLPPVNALETKLQRLADKFQDILKDLPQKIADLPSQHPGKDFIHILIPVENGIFSDDAPFTERELMKPMQENIQDRVADMMFSFLDDITKAFPNTDCFFNGKCSVWGDFLGVTIATNRTSALTLARQKNISYTDRVYFYEMDRILSPEQNAEYADIGNLANRITYICMASRADNIDPNSLRPVRMENLATNQPVKDRIDLQGRTWFWDKWPTKPVKAPAPAAKVLKP